MISAAVTSTESTRERWQLPALVLGLAFILAWPFALREIHHGDVYAVMGPYALAIIAALGLVAAKLHVHFVDRHHVLRHAAVGLVCGVVMTVLTYVAYFFAVRLVPGLATHVSALYAASSTETKGQALGWTLVILFAEEMLWRGPLWSILRCRTSRRVAFAVSLFTYVAVQIGSGSPVIALAALVCGAIWSAERALTGSIVAPLVSHLVWTPIVIHALPVTLLR